MRHKEIGLRTNVQNPIIYSVCRNVPLKNAKGSHAWLPIFVNLKSNTMKKSRCKDKAYFEHLQAFWRKNVSKLCYITFIWCFYGFFTLKWDFLNKKVYWIGDLLKKKESMNKCSEPYLYFVWKRTLLKTRKVVTPDYQSLLTLNLILWKNHDAKIKCIFYTRKHFSIYLH